MKSLSCGTGGTSTPASTMSLKALLTFSSLKSRGRLPTWLDTYLSKNLSHTTRGLRRPPLKARARMSWDNTPGSRGGVAWRLSPLAARMRLARELRGRGFLVRWHAYEFLLYRRGPVGVLILEPSRGEAELLCRADAPLGEVERDVREALERAAPGTALRVRVVG